MSWWNEMTEMQRVFAYIAFPATIIMVLQFVLSLIGFIEGGDADGLDGAEDFADADADIADFDDVIPGDIPGDEPQDIVESHLADTPHDHEDSAGGRADPLKLFTLRGIIGFFAIGGWTGVVALECGIPIPGAVLLSLLAGWLALYFVAWTIRFVLRMQQSGNLNLQNAIGVQGEVYIPIPPMKSGTGKVNVIIQDRLTELNAVTAAERTLRTGEKITVVGVESEGVLLVVPAELPMDDSLKGS
ncbi:MAG: hypothetical protein GX022_07815 [Clostridiaceae bacterium]|nr:hypothetical protein [Clostridiaceae bacterium]